MRRIYLQNIRIYQEKIFISDVKELTDEQLDKVTGGSHVYESNYGTFMVPDNLEDLVGMRCKYRCYPWGIEMWADDGIIVEFVPVAKSLYGSNSVEVQNNHGSYDFVQLQEIEDIW